MAENSKKRSLEKTDIAQLYEDPNELVNAVISVLQAPEQKTSVAENYANDKNQATEIQAYAKIAGKDWTYYVKALTISIGRNTDNQPNSKDAIADIDLGPAKVVSRQHATIAYNLTSRVWELHVLGRNGAKVDGAKVACGSNSQATPLYSGCVVDIGGTQMMFILPDATPTISKNVLEAIEHILPPPKSKRIASSISGHLPTNAAHIPLQPNQDQQAYANGYYYPAPAQNNLKAFQMFDNVSEQLKHNGQSNNSATAATNQANTQNDLAKDEAKDIKPPYSYATMITQAILSNPEGVLSLSQIYEWISKQYAFYRFSKSGWQNSIRHNLSLNKAFEKVPRRANEPGKGMKWQIAESYKNDFLKKVENGSLAKVRRGSSVSRQLQLHLAQHNDLPSSSSNQRKTEQQQMQQMQKFQQEFQLHANEAAVTNQIMNAAPMGSYGQTGYPTVQTYANNGVYPPPQLPPLKQQGGPPQQLSMQQTHTQLPLPSHQNQQQPGAMYSHSRGNSSTSIPQYQSAQYQQIPQQHQLSQNQVPVPPQQPTVPQQQDQLRPVTQESRSSDRTDMKPSSSSNMKQNIPSHPANPQRQKTEEYHDSKTQESSPKKEITTPPKSTYPARYNQNPYNSRTAGNELSNESTQAEEATTNNTTDQTKPDSNIEYGIITSPTKSFSVSAVEAYTPERGTRKKDTDKPSNHGSFKEKQRQNSGQGGNNLQSSPALWNFVQFSTPLGPNQGGSKDEDRSPSKNGGSFLPDSPLNMKSNTKRPIGNGNEKDLGDLKDVDLAKGFQK